MKYSREHTQHGHSEYQDEILKKFANENYSILPAFAEAGVLTVVSNGIYSLSVLVREANGNEDYCAKMNEFFGKAYEFFFGTEFDGPVESK